MAVAFAALSSNFLNVFVFEALKVVSVGNSLDELLDVYMFDLLV